MYFVRKSRSITSTARALSTPFEPKLMSHWIRRNRREKTINTINWHCGISLVANAFVVHMKDEFVKWIPYYVVVEALESHSMIIHMRIFILYYKRQLILEWVKRTTQMQTIRLNKIQKTMHAVISFRSIQFHHISSISRWKSIPICLRRAELIDCWKSSITMFINETDLMKKKPCIIQPRIVLWVSNARFYVRKMKQNICDVHDNGGD